MHSADAEAPNGKGEERGAPGDSIAVIGWACRLPGAEDPEAFWRLLADGSSAVSEMPEGRILPPLSVHGSSPDPGRATPTGGFLKHVDRFDADFFGISPMEAAATDPQQRLMLELAWECVEDARISPAALEGSGTGVFVGAMADDFAKLRGRLGADRITRHTLGGTQRGLLANRVSHTLGLRGPSLAVDTGQSSSLVAVHLACESLRKGESAMALAAGVHLIVDPDSTASVEKFGALSPDGRCFTFDARANGYVRGEGGVVVLLKPLSRALADGDPVHCVIRGSAMNNDGDTDGLAVPSAEGQEAVLLRACEHAGVDPDAVQYVELHGTGTAVGDPIEAAALGAAYGSTRSPGRPLLVGSAKTNIGHLEGAAGIAGLLKTGLCIEHRQVPASLNFETAHPRIPLDTLRLSVATGLSSWPRDERPLYAGVSSFGMGGTNAHAVLAEAPMSGRTDAADPRDTSLPASPRGPLPWVVSGRDASDVGEQAARLKEFVANNPGLSPVDTGFSLATTRTRHPYRAVVVASGGDDFLAGLDALARGTRSARTVLGSAVGPAAGTATTAFMFSGQGAQRLGAGRELYETYPAFAEAFDEIHAHFDGLLDRPLRDVLWAAPDTAEAALLDRTAYTQPALFAVSVALFRLFGHWGVVPGRLIGHSIGELAAAHAAGVLSLPDACALVAARGALMDRLPEGGAMAAVQAAVDEVEPLLRGTGVSIAAVNGPGSAVVSGDEEAVAAVVAHWASRGRRTSRLTVSHAFHSARMEPMLDAFREVADTLTFHAPTIPVISNVTGRVVDGIDTPDHWVRQIREPVRFHDGLLTLRDMGCTTYLELGPDAVLAPLARDALSDPHGAAFVSALRGGRPEPASAVAALAVAHSQGCDVDWAAVFPGGRRVALPGYAFRRRSHWSVDGSEPGRSGAELERAAEAAPPAGAVPAPAGPATSPSLRTQGVQDHRRLMSLVRDTVGMVLGYGTDDTVVTTRSFKELGFDSLSAVEFRDRLGAELDTRLSPTLTFDHPTPAAVVEHLHSLLTGTVELHRAERRLREVEERVHEPVAVVGMGCRFPGGVVSPEGLWGVVSGGVDVVSGFPVDRGWDVEGLFHPDPDHVGTSYVRRGGFVRGVADFDAGFFGISPREAVAMDPQQRLLLETSWEAVERARIDPLSLRGSRTGVFAGVIHSGYGPFLHEASGGVEGFLLTGNTVSVASGRIAYVLGLEGPALTVDTACSSSLVALHLACGALRRGECDLALAAGATVMPRPGMFVEFSRQRGLAVDGRCKAFGAGADGTVWGEGAASLVLERLSDAVRLGHPVLGVVVGSAVNQDGASNGLTAPSGRAQVRVIEAALRDAGVSASGVDVVEGHGTGTALGDPIEAGALLATYGVGRERPLLLGSLKSNFGHAQAAAGLAGVIKMVLGMRAGLVPGSLYAGVLSEHVDWGSGSVEVPGELVEWPGSGGRRRAGVSAFGISGTNAHVILEEAPECVVGGRGSGSGGVVRVSGGPVSGGSGSGSGFGGLGPVVWCLSAVSDVALRAQAAGLRVFLEERPEVLAADVGWSLATTRALFDHRATVVGEDRAELLTGLEALARGEAAPQLVQSGPGRGRTAFLFSGQGAQRPGMGAELYRTYPVFAEALDEVCGHFDAHLDRPLRELMFSSPGSDEAELLHRTAYAQPALFALETALYRLVRSLGPVPDFLIGHSVGEISAAHAAGVLTLADACVLVAARARLMEAAPDSGGMVAIEISEAEMRGCLGEFDGSATVAAVNSPRSVVISGEDMTVEKVAAYWKTRGRRTTRLRVSHAFHSMMMDGVLDEFRAVAGTVAFSPPRIPVVSNLTGRPASAGELCSPDYWTRQLRHAVRFMDGVNSLLDEGVTTFLELGPDATLTALVEDCVTGTGPTPTLTAVLRRERPEARTLAMALAEAHVANTAVARPSLGHDAATGLVDLPTYPFQRRRYWLEGPDAVRRPAGGRGGSLDHPLLGAGIDLAVTGDRWFSQELSADRPWFVREHRVSGRSVLPGSAMLEWALAAVRSATRPEPTAWTLRDVTFNAFLAFPDDGTALTVQAVAEATERAHRVRCLSRQPGHEAPYASDGGWTEHATVASAGPGERPRPAPVDRPGPTADMTEEATGRLYDAFRGIGLDYGPAYRALRRVRRDGDRAHALIVADEAARDQDTYLLHPVVLDACFQTVVAFTADDDTLRVPASVDRIDVYAPLPARVECHARRRATTVSGEVSLDLEVSTESGEVLATVEGLRFRAVPRSMLGAATSPSPRRYALTWQRRPDRPGTAAAPRARVGTWLVCGTDPGATADWCDRLAALGVTAVAVVTGAAAPRADSGAFHVDAVSDSDVRRMLDTVRGGTGQPVAGLILLAEPGDAGADDVVEATYRLARRTTTLLAGFLRAFAAERPEIVICSAGAAVPDGDAVAVGGRAPELTQSVLTALTRSVIAEYPDLSCVQIDLAPAEPMPAPEEILDEVSALGGSGHLAVRDGQWYEARLRDGEEGGAPADEASRAAAQEPVAVRGGATYLITGGLGGLGLATAAWLADKGAECLLLVGRTLPAETPPEVAALRARGVRIELRTADVADTAAAERVLAYAHAELPPLRGVVHAAGINAEGVLERADWSQLSQVMDPKVRGAWNLHRRTQDLELDFFVLYSALGALIGLTGQPGYLMANTFLDALAGHRRHQGLPALSVGWGTWADTGMAVDGGLVERFAASGIHGMSADEALHALDRVPADGPAHVALAAIDWRRYAAAGVRRLPDTLLGDVVPLGPSAAADAGTGADSGPGLAELVLARPEEAQEVALERLLDVVAVLLGMSAKERDAIRPTFRYRHLNELGFDSLTTIRLRNRLRADFSADVSADYLFGGGTALEIAGLICRQLTTMSVLATDDDVLDDGAETEVLTL
ncbi:type I polyketide synthase [Streptomyces scopuliridis]|nr:type I polyketide synthase [Streptomyces scopuliridis]